MSPEQSTSPGAGEPLYDPIRLVVWAGIEGVIGHAQMAGLLDLGRTIAAALPGNTLDEKLAAFELGEANREYPVVPGATGRLVLLRRDVFGDGSFCTLPWSPYTADLLRRYNEQMPVGGGALHPLHIVQHEVHRRLGNVVDLGTSDPATGQIALSRRGLQKADLAAEQARELLARGQVLYCIC